jgi:hypothetical protein
LRKFQQSCSKRSEGSSEKIAITPFEDIENPNPQENRDQAKQKPIEKFF